MPLGSRALGRLTRMRALIILVFACLVVRAQDFEQTWRGERLTIRIRGNAIGNLTWQLDTLSGHTNTRPKDYEDLWRTDLGWSAEDARQLEQWSSLHARYRKNRTHDRKARYTYPPNYAKFYGSSVSRDYAFRIAAMNASDLTSLRKSYRKLCGAACADSFVKVIEYFLPRFSNWWQQEGSPTARKIIPQLAAQTTDYGLGALCESAIRLTAAGIPSHHEVVLDIAVHPKKYLTNYTGTTMVNHILIEVVDDPEIGGPKLPLAIHELTHQFYDFARLSEHKRLIRRFVERPEPYSVAAYSVLNEALAAAVQLLAEKKLRSPGDYANFVSVDNNVYFDPFIAKAARAIVPLVEERIAAKMSVFDNGFVDAYLKAVSAALGPLTDSPRFLLSSRVLVNWPSGKFAEDQFNLNVRGMVGLGEWKGFKTSPNLGGVIFLTQGDLNQIHVSMGVVPPEIAAAVTEAARTHPAFAYAWQRSPKAFVYFLYGSDEERLLRVTKTFAQSDTAFSGLRLPQTN